MTTDVRGTLPVCVIGAGVSGLTTIKALRERRLPVVCFERSEQLGGLWRYHEAREETAVYRSTVVNTSKEMGCFSDFPMPRQWPTFLHHSKMLDYLCMYADHFELTRYIQFGHDVLKVDCDDAEWFVQYRDRDDAIHILRCRAVAVCTGHHRIPSMPTLEGMQVFAGVQLHSFAYRSWEPFVDKRVVIVGLGNSAGDLAVELSRHARSVDVASRSGAWVLPRCAPCGRPWGHAPRRTPGKASMQLAWEAWARSMRTQADALGLQCTHSLDEQHPTINDALVGTIREGRIVIRPNVRRLLPRAVEFEDGTVVDADVVIYATGYTIEFPFLSPAFVSVHDNELPNVYRLVWPLGFASLGLIGFVQPLGSIVPIAEQQARWFASVISGQRLPPWRVQMEECRARRSRTLNQWYPSRRHTIQVDYFAYMEALAQELGNEVDVEGYREQDPELYELLRSEFVSPHQYRLSGPFAWPRAQDAFRAAVANYSAHSRTRSAEQFPAPEVNPPRMEAYHASAS